MQAERSVEPIGTNKTCGLAYFSDFASRRLASRSGSQLSFTPNLPLFAGDHGGAVIPVPIPNTEVKGSIAEGSASPGRARVGRRQLFYFMVLRAWSSVRRASLFLQKAGDVLLSPLRGVVADSTRPYPASSPCPAKGGRGTFAAHGEGETPARGGKPSAYPPSDSESRSDALAGVQFVAKRT